MARSPSSTRYRTGTGTRVLGTGTGTGTGYEQLRDALPCRPTTPRLIFGSQGGYPY